MPKTNAPTKKTDAATSGQDADKPKKPGGELGKDAFLKLLVAQLKYQDPSKPMDNSQFLAQTAQFTTVEKLEDLASAEQSLLNAQLQLGASNLIGKTVTYADQSGAPQTGVVTAAKFYTAGPPTLHVGNTDIALASVTQVSDGTVPAPTQTAATQAAPAQTAPAQTAPAQTGPAHTAPAQTAPAQTRPAQTTPAQTGPAPTAPAQTGPAQTPPVQTPPAQTGPAQTMPAPTVPAPTASATAAPPQATPTSPAASRPVEAS